MNRNLIITNNLAVKFEAEISYDNFIDKFQWVINSFNKKATFISSNGKPLPESYWQQLELFNQLVSISYTRINENTYEMTHIDSLLYKIFQKIFYWWLDADKAILCWQLLSHEIEEVYSSDYNLAIRELDDMHESITRDWYLNHLDLAYLCYSKVNTLNKNPHPYMKIFQMDRDWVEFIKWVLKMDRSIWYRLRKIKYEVNYKPAYYIHYIVFCILFSWKELCFVYDRHPSEFARIIEKKDINNYIDQWCYTFNLSQLVWNSMWYLTPEKNQENRENKKSRNKLTDDLKDMAEIAKDVKVKIDITDTTPKFMSTDRKSSEINEYKTLENIVWDHGEITKVKNKGKATTVKAKKHFKYK